jgi:hypothetical protein
VPVTLAAPRVRATPGNAEASPPKAPWTSTRSPGLRCATWVSAAYAVAALGTAATAAAGPIPVPSRLTVIAASTTVTEAYPPSAPVPDKVTTGSATWKPSTPSPSARIVPATSSPGT